MKKVLWLIVLVLLLATFSDHPLLKPYRAKFDSLFSEEVLKAGKLGGDQLVRTIAKKMQGVGSELGQGQQAELQRITGSKEVMAEFYRTYCEEKQFHPLFFGPTQVKICEVMEEHKYALLN